MLFPFQTLNSVAVSPCRNDASKDLITLTNTDHAHKTKKGKERFQAPLSYRINRLWLWQAEAR